MKFNTVVAALGLTSSVSACLLHSEREDERTYVRTGKRDVRPSPRAVTRQASTTIPIGTGDRFAGGCVAPVGLGTEDRDLESVLNVKEVTSALRGLKRAYPGEVELFTPPFKTYEGRELPGAVVAGKDGDVRTFIMSGIHARERGGPDNVIYFLSDLLAARKAGSGVAYGGKNYTAEEVETALGGGIVVLPITNPDGVNYDQESGECWRKNRNPESAVGDASGRDIGIDLNRNYDFVWDYKKAFNLKYADSPASDDPRGETFYGTGPASEAETKAVVWTLDQYQNITWFMDLHSFAGSLLYAWGDDDPGTEEPEQNFVNAAFDGTRGAVGGEDPADAVYKEYFTAADLKAEEEGSLAMINAMKAAGDVQYDAYPAVGLYPTSGASNDYAMGRYYGKLACGSSRMFGLTLEFGVESTSDPNCPFYPDNEEYHRNVRQVGAGFVEMMLIAAGPKGDPLILEC
jgi:murein tripeptide amidase MpaA